MNSILAVNSVIEWLPMDGDEAKRMDRVLWSDNSSEQVVIIAITDLVNPKSLPLPSWRSGAELIAAIESGQAFRRIIDPLASLANPDPAFVQKHWERMARAWEIIKDMVDLEPEIYLEEHRGPLVLEAATKFKVTRKEVYKFLKRYWRGGKIKYALLPAFNLCGAPGADRPLEENAPERPKRGRPPKAQRIDPDYVGVNVTEEHKKIFSIAIDLYFNTKKQFPLKDAYGQMIDNHFNVGCRIEGGVRIPVLPPASQLPTYEQFRYWYQKVRDLTKSIIAREGKKEFELNSRPILGNSTQMAFGPGSIFQIDATIGDIYLVSTLNRNWIIGRPVIYFVVDVFSRMVVGIYVGLEGPSWTGAMMALANATIDKVSFCAQYGVEITPEVWPCRYLPESILGDRGEMIGRDSDVLADSLGIRLANCPPYRADWKGIVEQTFRRANLKSIKWLPGAVRKRMRGERDHRLDATLDLRQFTKIIILTMLRYNLHQWMDDYPLEKDLIAVDVSPLPIELWEWGIRNRAGHLRERSPDIVRLNLMPHDTATVTPQGIKYKGMHYTTERALQEQWFVRARSEGTWRVPISYDPRVPAAIYLRAGNGGEFDACSLVPGDGRFADAMLEDVIDYFELQNARGKLHEGVELQADAALRAQIAATEAEAVRLKEDAGPQRQSNSQRVMGIGSNRAEEKERNRQDEAFDLRDEPGKRIPGKVLSISQGSSRQEAEPSRGSSSTKRHREFLDILKGGDGEDKP